MAKSLRSNCENARSAIKIHNFTLIISLLFITFLKLISFHPKRKLHLFELRNFVSMFAGSESKQSGAAAGVSCGSEGVQPRRPGEKSGANYKCLLLSFLLPCVRASKKT